MSNPAASTTIASLPTPAQALTITATIARDATNTVSAFPYAAGLHLTAPLAIVTSNSSFNATLTWPSSDVTL